MVEEDAGEVDEEAAVERAQVVEIDDSVCLLYTVERICCNKPDL
jgi:hypothetical protein